MTTRRAILEFAALFGFVILAGVYFVAQFILDTWDRVFKDEMPGDKRKR